MFRQLATLLLTHGGSERATPSMDGILAQADQHVFNLETRIEPSPESKPRTPFDSNLPREQVSMLNFSVRQRLKIFPKAGPLIANMRRGARLYDQAFPATRSEASPEFIARLEAKARAAGARDIAYVQAPRNAIFRDKGLPAEYAILFTVEMDKEPMATAPSFQCQLEVMDGYKRMSSIALKLAHFLRRNGYAGYPGTALGGLTDYVYLAELAGLGAIGYHGLLISPTPTSPTCRPCRRRAGRTSIFGYAISAPCARSASVSVRSMPSSTSRGRAAMAACRPSITRPVAITSRLTTAALFAWPPVPLARLAMTRSRTGSRATTAHPSSASLCCRRLCRRRSAHQARGSGAVQTQCPRRSSGACSSR